jgi:hypothetical protein
MRTSANSAFSAIAGWGINSNQSPDVGQRWLEYEPLKILTTGWGYQLYKPSLTIGCMCTHCPVFVGIQT